jgi:outer membrane receptor protein involved in Fe transport
MKAICLSIFLFFTGILCYSQTNTDIIIRGQLLDSLSQEPIPFATTKIFSEQQKVNPLKVGATDENGFFKFELKNPGKYFLSFEFLGKNPFAFPFTVENEKDLDLGKINMSDNTHLLQEVTVSSQKALVKVDLDKITYNMEEDPDAKTNNVLEMLKKVPMVTVDGEENIQLKGSSNFKFYMNGKPSNMLSNNPKDVLRSIPANTVKNIEVITDPGAKYDAEGVSGIINITTQSQSSLGGYTVSLNAGGSSLGGYNGGTFFSVKYGKIGLTGNFNYNKSRNPKSDLSTFRENYNSNENRYLTQTGWNKSGGNFMYGYGEFSYEIDTLNLVTVNINRYGGDFNSDRNLMVLMENISNDAMYKYDQSGNTKNAYASTTLGTDYQRTFSVKERLLTASYKLEASNEDMDAQTQVNALLNFNSNRNRQFSDADSYEHTFQLDYTTPIAKIHTLEAGAKFIKRINESNSGMSIYSPLNEWANIPSDNDEFKHVQDILAAYAGYSLKYKKWGFKTGLRYEATWLNARFPINNAQDFKAEYANLVPSVTATYMLKPGQSFRAGYNLRIQRPGIWYLNPYVNTTDTSYIRYGNPGLDAVKFHNFNLNFNLYKPKFNANANLSYSFTNDGISDYTWIENLISYTSYFNMSKEKRLNLSTYLNWSPTAKLRIFGNLSGSYSDLKSNNGTNLHNDGFSGNFYGGAQYTVPWDVILGLNGYCSTPRVTLQGESMAYYFYNLSVAKNFLKKKLNVRIYANNPLRETIALKNKQQSEAFYYESISHIHARQFGISVSYRFGEMKTQIKKAQRSIQNDDQMKGSDNAGGSSSGTQQPQ